MDRYKVQAKCAGCESGSGTSVEGRWSPIYAQGMMVELDNGLRFVANFRYNLKSSVSKDPYEEKDVTALSEISKLTSDSLDKFDSVCSETMVGSVLQTSKAENYVQDSMRNFRAQCFYGIQTMHYDVESTSSVDRGNQV
jgi:hypothetical protein